MFNIFHLDNTYEKQPILTVDYTGPQKKNCRFWDGDYTFLLYFFPLNPNPASKVGG